MKRFLPFCLAAALAAFLTDAQADNHFSLGAEGFHDRYQEPGQDLRVNDTTNYTSVTGSYQHDANGFFSALDGRYSWGKDNYKSVSGSSNGAQQYEGEVRARTGMEIATWHGMLMPYLGVGLRQFFDQGKGIVTNLGDYGYDRHITQLYAPFGISYPFTYGGWTFTPNIEADVLLWGRVSTHLNEVPNNPPLYGIVNDQHSGYGFRGEFMAGQKYHYFGWEAGPFFRYWKVQASDIATDPYGGQWLEPDNTRLQLGLAFRLTY